MNDKIEDADQTDFKAGNKVAGYQLFPKKGNEKAEGEYFDHVILKLNICLLYTSIADKAREFAAKTDETVNKGENSPYKNKALKPFDLGVGMQAGFEYQQFGINLGFEYGLLNTSAVEKTKVNNMNFYVGLGYRF